MGISLSKHVRRPICIFNYSDSQYFHPSKSYRPLSKPLANVRSCSDINALILDYLTMAGYPNAAKKFSAEANLPPQQVNDSIEARQQIQTAIHRGDIAQAISDLNDLDPEVSPACALPYLHSLAVIKNRVLHAPLLGSSDLVMRNNHYYMSLFIRNILHSGADSTLFILTAK